MSTIDEHIRRLEKVAVSTSKGSYVPMDEVRKILEGQQAAKEEAADKPKPRTLQQAIQMAKNDEELTKGFPKATPGLGAAVVATQQPPSASRA